jgi:hypothetical protein
LEVDDWKPMQVANKATEKRIVEKDNLPF